MSDDTGKTDVWEHRIWVISGDDDLGYYTEGKAKGYGWFCFEVMSKGELVKELHEELGFTTKAIDEAIERAKSVPEHDHDQCIINFGIASLREGCDWVGHAEAISEQGFCPVCQH